MIEVSFAASKYKKLYVVHKCFEIFQFFMYNLKDNQKGSLGRFVVNLSVCTGQQDSL